MPANQRDHPFEPCTCRRDCTYCRHCNGIAAQHQREELDTAPGPLQRAVNDYITMDRWNAIQYTVNERWGAPPPPTREPMKSNGTGNCICGKPRV